MADFAQYVSRDRELAILRLVADVCLLGGNAQSWTSCLAEGLQRLFRAKMVGLAWARLPERPGEFNRAEIQRHFGMSEHERRIWNQYYWRPGNEFRSEFLRRLVNIRATMVTVRRQDLMSDAEWYALPEVQEVHQACGIDANLSSLVVAPRLGRLFGIGIHRHWGEEQFTIRERTELRRFHVELSRAWRDRLSRPQDCNRVVDGLPQRLREVLWLLCLGKSEKEVALELELSQHTVHNHVRRLYHAFQVVSRGELLSKSMKSGLPVSPVDMPALEMNEFRAS